MTKITQRKLEKSWINIQSKIRFLEMFNINGKYSLEYKGKPIVNNLSIREFYYVLEGIKAFYLLHKPELIEKFLEELEDLKRKYK
jgi:hypothetical protein